MTVISFFCFVILIYLTILYSLNDAISIQFTNTTDIVILYEMLPSGIPNGASFCGISSYIDVISNNTYYFLTTSGNSIISDIYNNKLYQYNNSNNKVLSSMLPFYISKYSYPTSICTSPKSLNIIQCYYNECNIFINSINEWTSKINIGCNGNTCNNVAVSCFDDNTFFLVYKNNNSVNEFRYTLLSSNGKYIANNKFLYYF
eukprot:453535_1